tara:strand:- start:576 stop:770 length:195 start_codon:yes stop_codon:yes gene_type:complete
MAKKELKSLSMEELVKKLKESEESFFNLRFQKVLQQLEHPKKISLVKKEIARIKTFIRKIELKN